MSAARPLLEVRGPVVEFAHRRGALRALDGVSFEIARGEVLGIVGESGAGKSLTGAAIIGLLEPSWHIAGGSIHLDGERIDDLPAERLRRVRGKRIGAIFQDPLISLNPLMTVDRQLVETIRAHLPLDAEAARARSIALLRETGIPAPKACIDHHPHQFSGGMRQRVVIALALAAEPELIVADEPTTTLDVSIQAQAIGLLERLGRDHGTAVMLVTHDMGVIAKACDRVAVMYAGRIVEIGPVREVVHAPAHPYTAGLMGSIPSMDGARERLVQIDGAAARRAAGAERRHGALRWHRRDPPARPGRRGPGTAAATADDLPGSVREPEPALVGAAHRRRAAGGAQHRARPAAPAGSRGQAAGAGAARRGRCGEVPASVFGAGSGSASRSRARSPRRPSSWCATSRPRRSMSRSRRRC